MTLTPNASRSLRTLYTFGWQSEATSNHEANPSHTTGSFVSYHDLGGVDVRRYVAHGYMPYWTREAVGFLHNTTEVGICMVGVSVQDQCTGRCWCLAL